MATVKNLTNFTGTIDGLVYYTRNGKQFVRADTKKTTTTKSKAPAKKILPGTETLNIINALRSMNHLVNAMKNEFQTLGADFHTDSVKVPSLENAVRDNSEIKFTVRGTKTGVHLIILQISFKTGDFQRKKIALADAHCIRKNTYTVETEYQARKGYTDLLLLYGQQFLKAVPIQVKKNRNS